MLEVTQKKICSYKKFHVWYNIIALIRWFVLANAKEILDMETGKLLVKNLLEKIAWVGGYLLCFFSCFFVCLFVCSWVFLFVDLSFCLTFLSFFYENILCHLKFSLCNFLFIVLLLSSLVCSTTLCVFIRKHK